MWILKTTMTLKWTGVTNQQTEMINLTKKSNGVIYNRAGTLKSDSN